MYSIAIFIHVWIFWCKYINASYLIQYETYYFNPAVPFDLVWWTDAALLFFCNDYRKGKLISSVHGMADWNIINIIK